MKNKNRYMTSLMALTLMVMAVSTLSCTRAEQKPAITSLEVTEGVRVVEESMALQSLTIAEGASLVAPEGKSLTMTVYGVGTTIKPGDYKGNIYLTVTDELMAQSGAGNLYRTAILIEDGRYVPGKSVAAAVQGGMVTDKATTGVSISSNEYNFEGIIVKGNSEYTIDGVNIYLESDQTEKGGNDFIGFGSGIASMDNAKVTINNSDIHLMGITRTAFHAGGNSVTTLNNCRLSNNSPFSDKMNTVWMLGFRGTNRSTQCTENATVYYNNCYIMSNGWGVCSVDGGIRTRMYFKDSTLELKGSTARGYGAFSIGDCFISYDHCTLNVNGYPLLIGGGAGMANQKSDGEITNGTIINSPINAVMIFRAEGIELTVNEGSTLNTGLSTFVVKGSNAYLNIDNAELNPDNGVVLQLMDNDDPGMGPSQFMPPVGEVDKPIPGRDLTAANPKEDVFMALSNMEVKGDFYNSTTDLKANCRDTGRGETADWPGMDALMEPQEREMPSTASEGGIPPEGGALSGGEGMGVMNIDTTAQQGVKNLDLKFANVKINGVISAATAAYKDGVTVIDVRNCEEIGNVTQTAHEPVNNGVIVSFDKDCVWTVAGTSYLTSLAVAEGAVIKAPEGKSLTMTVDGVKTPVKAGTYKGKIVITLS